MKRGFSFIAIILFSIVAASAQTKIKEGQADLRRSREGERRSAYCNEGARSRDTRVLQLGPTTTYLKEGLSTEEVAGFLGQPTSVSERQERYSRLTTYIFSSGGECVIVVEFVNGVLVGSRTQIREYVNISPRPNDV
jgi:hypothetical protein